jgi:2-phospho-L-lactate/phosphoenolpyruvate guanylyltransferase
LAVYKVAVYAVVPVKNLADSKRRLSEVFTPQERKELTLAMLEDVLNALQASVVDEIVVVGEDSAVEQTAKKFGSSYLSANGASLNPAIEEATSWCKKKGSESVLVLPADVPLLDAKDINRIVELGVGGSAVVLSPSKNWGTNALYQNPLKQIPACFGPKSFLSHIQEAYCKGISVRLHFSPGLATDIDSAEDLKKLFEAKNSTVCRRVLEELSVKSKRARDYFALKALR